MFRGTLVALLGIGGAQEDTASLLQKRSGNALISRAADVIKHTGITQLDEAVTGKECKAFLGGEEPRLVSEQTKNSIWNSAWFDGLEPPIELGVALACPHHIFGIEDFPFPDKRESEKTCKNHQEAVKECSTALKNSCKWLKRRGSKIINQRSQKRRPKFTGEFASAQSILDSLDCNAYREPTQEMFDGLFAAFGDIGQALNFGQILGGHLGATESLPPAILAFYGAVQGLQGDKALTALQFIHDDAYWAHTQMATAIGKEDIGDLFKKDGVRSRIFQTNTVQYVSTDGDASSGASSYVVTRYGFESGSRKERFGSVDDTDQKREAFVLVGGKIKMVWTTNGNVADPTSDFKPWYDANHIEVSGGEAFDCPAFDCPDAVEVVQTAIEVYFNGFVAHDASAMQSAYHETNPLFLADFQPDREAPVACSASDDCGTFPYINTFDALLPAFEAFVQQPSHIELNRKFTSSSVYGDFAFVSTVSYGCEGNMVTPEGDTPAPNRELFVATRTDADGWKIRFYMFSIDPDSPIMPPVFSICDLNRNTPGSVWPPTLTWAHRGATESLPPAILAFYGAVQGDEVTTALQFIHDDAYWSHTQMATAIGKEEIGDLFKKDGVRSMIAQTNTVQYVATDGDASSGASSYVVTRYGSTFAEAAAKKDQFGSDWLTTDRKREAFVLVGGKIKMVWTTNGDVADPTTSNTSDLVSWAWEADNGRAWGTTSLKPWYDANHILVSGGDNDPDAVEVVQTAIEVYFNGFVAHDASAMQSAYHETNPLFLADFQPDREAPVACSASDDCGTFPYMNTFDALLPAFEAFVKQPSHIELNREFTPAGVYGDFAFVSTVSYGCEGNMVTPEGATPAPNRELFVATRTDADGWKIRFYMFSIDPNIRITPPVEICDLNRDTPGSVWPPTTD